MAGLDVTARESLEQMGGEALVSKIFGLFVERAPETMREMRAAAEAGERPEVERLAHALASSAAYVGAAEVEGLGRTLEHAAPSADSGEIEGMIARLDEVVAAVLPEVEAVCS